MGGQTTHDESTEMTPPVAGAGSLAAALFAHAPVALAIFGVDGQTRYANSAFAELVGRGPGELVDRHLGDYLPAMWPRLLPVFRWVAVSGQAVAELEISTQLGTPPAPEHHWLVGAYPVEEQHHETGGVGIVVVDITARERAEREVRVLARASDLFAKNLGREEAIDHAARLAIPEFADACILYLESPHGGFDRVALVHDDPETERRLAPLATVRRIAQPGGVIDLAIRAGRTTIMPLVTDADRVRDADGPQHLALLEGLHVVSAITAPVAIAARPIGAIALLYTGSSGRRYRSHDSMLVQELGRRIAQILDTIRLAESATRAASRLDLLARVGDLLLVELDLHQRLQEVTRLLLPDLGDAAGVYLLEGDRLRLVTSTHRDPSVSAQLAQRVLPSHGVDSAVLPSQCLREGRPVVRHDLDEDTIRALAGIGPGAKVPPMRSVLYVPLTGDDGPIGVMSLVWSRSRRYHDEDDVRIATELAHRVAPAVVHAQRYERDREVVEVLQRSLLPASLPRLPGVTITGRYLPAGEGLRIGGDWYDAIVLPDGRLFLAIGDVVGHGVRAAAAMGRLRVALQVFALEGLGPAAMLERVNRHFRNLDDIDMATLCVVLHDPATSTLQIASAGHPPPVVRDAGGRVALLDVCGGPPICALALARYTESTHELLPGSTVVLYTDGLVEQRSEDLGSGLGRLVAAVAQAPAETDALVDDLLLVRAPDAVDDVAVLAMQVESAVHPLELDLEAHPRSLAGMRQALARWLRRIGASDELAGDLVLVANEAVANAVEHAYGPGDALVHVRAELRDGSVCLAVRDHGRWRPARDVGGGRGLTLIRGLTDELRVDSAGNGTELWIRKALERSADA
jgi:serine phosphatase RsbU (regulator of sigma subunit)